MIDPPDFVGDNDHGDALPELKCGSCGVPWVDHMGIMGVCADNAALREDLKASLEAHDEMRLEIVRLTKERDEARRVVKFFDTVLRIAAGLISTMPQYESTHPEEVLEMLKKTQQAMNNIAKLDEELGL